MFSSHQLPLQVTVTRKVCVKKFMFPTVYISVPKICRQLTGNIFRLGSGKPVYKLLRVWMNFYGDCYTGEQV